MVGYEVTLLVVNPKGLGFFFASLIPPQSGFLLSGKRRYNLPSTLHMALFVLLVCSSCFHSPFLGCLGLPPSNSFEIAASQTLLSVLIAAPVRRLNK